MGGENNALKKFKALLPGNEIIGEADFISPAKNKSEDVKQKIADWVQKLG
jgi:hypothetical protein